MNERPFLRALIASLLNPKAILFFVAFFVQFVDPSYAWPVLSYGVLFVILQICSVAYLSMLIVAGDGLAQTFRRRRRLARRQRPGGRGDDRLRGEARHWLTAPRPTARCHNDATPTPTNCRTPESLLNRGRLRSTHPTSGAESPLGAMYW